MSIEKTVEAIRKLPDGKTFGFYIGSGHIEISTDDLKELVSEYQRQVKPSPNQKSEEKPTAQQQT